MNLGTHWDKKQRWWNVGQEVIGGEPWILKQKKLKEPLVCSEGCSPAYRPFIPFSQKKKICCLIVNAGCTMTMLRAKDFCAVKQKNKDPITISYPN